MAKYTVTHSCGHDEEVTLFGPTRERERKLEWLASIPCKECREREAKRVTDERTKELGLPELQGSEKQINWAQGIRLEKIVLLRDWADKAKERIDSLIGRIEGAEAAGNAERVEALKARLAGTRTNLAMVVEAMDGVSSITEAHWWIEHRDDNVEGFVKAYKARQDAETEKTIEEETKPAMVVMEPEKKETSTVATVKVHDKEVVIQSDRDEHIRLTIKKHGFTWDGSRSAWIKPVTEMTGPAKDLGPDTARILLEAGIPVKAYPDIMQAVKDGSYERETARWISRSTKDHEKLYIRKIEGVNLPGGCKTTYNGDGIISPTLWREVREFAALNGYKITKLADGMLKAAEAATVSVKLPDGETVQASAGDALKAILESSRDVLDDLKEED